ncbi:MAG TPA: class I SAM-dependent methyltransferase [Candidatus Limnocylindrales bacterium]|jgi:hypothetical protein
MPLSRRKVVQRLLSLYEAPRYLEIGVSEGATFNNVQAGRKVAVDPAFAFDVQAARASQPNAEFHEVTSDAYFGTIMGEDDEFDVIFLDGLHVFEQTLRDFTNAIDRLSPTGVILIDDVVPESHFAAIGDVEVFRTMRRLGRATTASWMGDVYRLVFFIQTFFQQYTYRTIEDNHGQLVAWRERRATVPERRVEAVARTSYDDVVLQPADFNRRPFDEIVRELELRHGATVR